LLIGPFRQRTFIEMDDVLQFHSIFMEKEIEKDYLNFLKQEQKENQLQFLLEAFKLKNLKETKEIITQTLKIVEEFLLNEELNVSQKSTSFILEQYQLQKSNSEEWIIDSFPNEFFNRIEDIVTGELYYDSWKRFLRTKTCQLLTKKFQNNSNLCTRQISEHFSYQDDYFKHPFIFDQDFQFADLLFKDSFHWQV
jgi:hypothetical protein